MLISALGRIIKIKTGCELLVGNKLVKFIVIALIIFHTW